MTVKHKNAGITLVELMVTLAVVGILTAVAIPAYDGYLTTARAGECVNEADAIILAEAEFALNNNGKYFKGNSATALKTDSGGIYTPSQRFANGKANCTVAVTTNAATSQYTITLTGANKLAGAYTRSITGP